MKGGKRQSNGGSTVTENVKKDSKIFDDIDSLPMSGRMSQTKERYLTTEPRIDGRPLKLLMESYKETEGDDLEIRRARALARVFEGMTLYINPEELTAGSQSRFLRGAWPAADFDWKYWQDAGVYLEKDGKRKLTLGTPVLEAWMNEEDFRICEEAAAYFKGKTPTQRARQALREVWGSWYEDAMEVDAVCPRFEHVVLPVIGTMPRMETVLKKGLRGIIEEAETNLTRFTNMLEETDPEKLYFWQAVIIVCQGVITLAHRYAELARQMVREEKDPTRRRELEDIARACDWVPEHPARNFHEALQSTRLVSLAIATEHDQKAGPNLGRIDQYLYPFFKKDMEEGRLSLDKAAELIGDIIAYLSRGERVHHLENKEANQSTQITHLTLGGVDRQGKATWNELTYLVMHVQGLLRYPEPHTTFRWTVNTPQRFMDKALEVNRRVSGIPMYVNDEHVVELLVKMGYALEEARDYAMNGCSQPVANPRGYFNPMHLNTPLALDLALHNGVSPATGKRIGCETGDPANFKTFDEVNEAFKKQFEFLYRRLLRAQSLMVHVMANYWRVPMMSAIESDCVKNGKDFLRGGAGVYLGSYNKDRGNLDTADSLMAIKKIVFDDRKLTMKDLITALDSNFAGERGEEIQRMCVTAPKFGNDIDEVDYLARDTAKFTAGVVTSEKNAFGSPYAVNRNGLSWHYRAGKGIGALPNGRKAGMPLYDGSMSPMPGMDKRGPTAVLKSALKADYTEAAVAILNMKFPLSLVSNPDAREKIGSMVETFLGSGGTHIQFNFLDKAVLLDARKHPEKHKDLVVRVAGYSAFWINLTPEVQDEIIARTEHSL